MATRKSYEDYLKTITPGMVGADGRFNAPSAGVNYQAEGMTPEQYYQFMTQQVENPTAIDGMSNQYQDRGPADASWIEGAQNTGAKGEFLAALLATVGGFGAAGAYGGGGAAGLGGATTAPVTGGTLGVTGTALPELATIGGEGVAGLGGLEAGGLGAFPSAIGTETGFGGGFGSAGAGAGIEGYGGGLLAPGGAAIGGSSMIDKAGSFLKDNPTLAKIGGAVIGAASAKDTQTSASQSKDPWAPAQPYLLDNLKTNAAMQEYYRANPFSNEQKTAYQGLLNTVANNAANAAPMTANANAFMKSNRGRMPAMQGLLSGTQAAPIDWTQYANIGRK